MAEPDPVQLAALAIMRARVNRGWTFGKRAAVMAIDLEMAEAALNAVGLLKPRRTEISAPPMPEVDMEPPP